MKEQIYRYSSFDTYEKAVLILPILLRAADPEVEEIRTNTQTFYPEDLKDVHVDARTAEGMLDDVKKSLWYSCRMRFRNFGECILTAEMGDYTPVIHICFDGDCNALMDELEYSAQYLYPEIFGESDVLLRGRLLAGGMLLAVEDLALSRQLTLSDFWENEMSRVILPRLKRNVISLAKPVHLLELDWLISMFFDEKSDSFDHAELRLLYPLPRGGAITGPLNPAQMADAMRDVQTVFEKELKVPGERCRFGRNEALKFGSRPLLIYQNAERRNITLRYGY